MAITIDERRVRVFMAQNGIKSDTELYRKADLAVGTFYRVLRGEAFSSDTLGKLAKALNCSPIDLLNTTGFPSPHVHAPAVMEPAA